MVNTFQPDYAVSFADMLAFEMQGQGYTAQTLADKSLLSPDQIKALLLGQLIINSDMAHALDKALGRGPAYWLNIEANYAQDQANVVGEKQGN